ncbi:hypothetical protein 2 [Sanxia sobemo-like virus 3]|uniref:hypothetical protein 2 n=1 Tax=Sanxia sobemo-like virus 3 TaxID=1923382 RepID=UPI00090CCB0F|nr:hypothetical protein 2 [Sanxia sobemo-like virus 3]APG75871.1 hypothetical protein 2 [Sanxia sobemo-like virus 3]
MNAVEVFSSLRWEIPDDFMTYSHFLRVLDKLDMASSPGYPYMRRAPVNKILFRVDEEGAMNPSSVDYIWQTVSQRIAEFGDADPVRFFIKQEPHKLKKLVDGRNRLISSVSVVDQIIDHMLFDSMNENMVDNWNYNPIKIGWSPVKGGWKAFPTGKRIAIDKSAWDWTVQMWMLELCLTIRLALCRTDGPNRDLWLKIAIYRYKQLFLHPLFITSGGLLLRQQQEGVQKSGCVNTLADNSLMQWILHARVCLEHGVDIEDDEMWVMGDDTSQSAVPDGYEDWLREYCIVKECQPAREFCGFRFDRIHVEPLYKGKHAFNLLHLDEKNAAEVATSYALLYHRSRHRDWMRNLFESMSLNIFPLWYYDAIYDGVE